LCTEKTRNLADAPEAPEYNHIDEPAKALFKPCTKFLDQVLHAQVASFVPPTNAPVVNTFQAMPHHIGRGGGCLLWATSGCDGSLL
jgi:hypothetical protein